MRLIIYSVIFLISSSAKLLNVEKVVLDIPLFTMTLYGLGVIPSKYNLLTAHTIFRFRHSVFVSTTVFKYAPVLLSFSFNTYVELPNPTCIATSDQLILLGLPSEDNKVSTAFTTFS